MDTEQLTAQLSTLARRVQALELALNDPDTGLENVNTRLDDPDTGLERLDERLDNHQSTLTTHGDRLDSQLARIQALEADAHTHSP